jgi:hypothetical protein
MALQPGINTPSALSGQGNIKRDSGVFSGHIFNAGLQKPQILESLLVKYPKYYLLAITEKIKANRDLYNNTFNWTVLGRTRQGASVTATTAVGGATVTLTLDTPFAAASDNSGYWLPNDTIYNPGSGKRAVITAVGNAGGFQTITIAFHDGANFAAGDFAVAAKIGHAGSSYGEGSAGSGGFRSYLPDQEYNVSTIARRGIKVTRNMMKDKTILDDKSWWFKQEDIEQKEFMRDIEATVLLGTRFKSSTIGGRSQSRGLLEYAQTGGKNVTYAGATGAKEADLQNLIKQLVPEQGGDEIFLGCGVQLFAELQSELGNNYRTVPTSAFRTATGIDVQTYEFFGKKISLAYLDILSDPAILPSVAAGATAIDYSRFGIALDFGTVEGGASNIEMGWVDRMTQKAITGMGSDSYEISNAFDGVQMELLAEFMPIVYSPARLGTLRANS